MYSQFLEEKFIIDFFGENKGFFLDIGAFDGKDMSNSYKLAELGWHGICVEPVSTVFDLLCQNHKTHNSVQCINAMVGLKTEFALFKASSSGLGCAANYFVDNEHTQKIDDWQSVFVPSFTFTSFANKYLSGIDRIDFLTIDTEGLNLEVFFQIPLNKYSIRCLCLEWSGERESIYSYLQQYGFSVLYENDSNLLVGRESINVIPDFLNPPYSFPVEQTGMNIKCELSTAKILGNAVELEISVSNCGKISICHDKLINVGLKFYKHHDGNYLLQNEYRANFTESTLNPGDTFLTKTRVDLEAMASSTLIEIDIVKEGHYWFSQIGNQQSIFLSKRFMDPANSLPSSY